jgi:YVTN family beta-propeller protein
VLLVTDVDSGRLVFNSVSEDRVSGAVTTGAGAHAIALDPEGPRAFVTNQTAGSVTVMNLVDRQVTQTTPVGSKPNGLLFVAR